MISLLPPRTFRNHLLRAAQFLLLISLGWTPIRAQAQGAFPVPAPLFAEETPLAVTIELDFDDVLDDRSEESENRPGALTYTTAEGLEQRLDLGIKTRGFFRLYHLNCDVPPLRLNFKKKQVAGTVFAGQNKLKLVTHCRNGSDTFEQNVVTEYLLYRAYNLLTDASFQVRLLEITYVDSEARDKSFTRYGFLIEDEHRMSERNGATLIEHDLFIHPEATNRKLITLMSVFQYMIGNTDWGVSTRHNTRLIFEDSSRTLVVVPYDFDMAGLIDAPYANPAPKLNLSSVRERKFMGFCRSDEEFAEVFDRFESRKEQILALFRGHSVIDEKRAERSVRYVEDFFETIHDARKVRRAFVNACQKYH